MKSFIISIKILVFFTVITGIIYPLMITGLVQVIFPRQANGSIIYKHGKAIGSELIGQQFDTNIYFSSRPSAIYYNPLPSGGSNYGLTNIKLKNLVAERKLQFLFYNQLDTLTDIPSEMLFASASGLDPHISPNASLIQVERIAKARGFNNEKKQKLILAIKSFTEHPQFLCLGDERVNVLLLNLEIDKIK